MINNYIKHGTIDSRLFLADERELSARIGGNVNLADYIDTIDKFNRYAVYRFAYVTLPLQINNSFCTIGNCNIESKALSKLLKDCSSVILFTVTAGIESDRLIKRTQIKSKSEGFVLDAIASAQIEACADYVNSLITENLKCTGRFSPGYADFPIEFQIEILKYLNARTTVGISISDNFVMTPMKSITALIGIY